MTDYDGTKLGRYIDFYRIITNRLERHAREDKDGDLARGSEVFVDRERPATDQQNVSLE